MNDEVNVVVEPTLLEVILTNLDAVTKAIVMRYGLHPEADATEAAADVIRGLLLLQAVGAPPAATKAPIPTKAKVV